MTLGPVYIVIAACLGYVFCQFCHVQRYKVARKSGWYAYLLDTVEPTEDSPCMTLLPIRAGRENPETVAVDQLVDLNSDELRAYLESDGPLDRTRLSAVTIPKARIVFCQTDRPPGPVG